MTPTQIVINFLIALLIGCLAAYFAKGRGRNPVVWFMIGMFFAPWGLFALFLFPSLKESATQDIQELEVVPETTLSEKWYYLDEKHAQFGPVTLIELVDLCKQKKITPVTYVWSEGMQEWKLLKDVQGLLQYVERQLQR